MENKYIKIFNNETDQNDYLNTINESDDKVLLLNIKNNKISFSKDGTKDRKIKYNNDKYLPFEMNHMNKEFHVIPNDVDSYNIIDTTTDEIITNKLFDSRFKKNNKQPLYKIGLMSDVHYNDSDDSDNNPDTFEDDGAEYSQDLINALEFFKNEGVDFIACSGDISTDWSTHLKNYKLCIDKHADNLPIFTCSGNHDTKPKYKYHDLWKEVTAINPDNAYDIVYFKDYEQYSYLNQDTSEYDNYYTDPEGYGTSYYFKKYYKDTFDVFIYLNVEYGWNNRDNYDTHNCRLLNQDELLVHTEVNTDDDLHLYHPQTLQCLANILEEFKDHRCFIFTHLMFPDKAGNYHSTDEFGYYSYYEYAAYWNHADVLRGDQGEFIRNLMEQYDNNYWFCGHSHYKWNWEKLDHQINISKTNHSYNIHLPSLSRPLPLYIYWYANAPKDSEAGILEVYDNYVILKGAVLKEDNNDTNPYTLIDNYSDDDMEYVTADMFTKASENNESTIEQLDNNYIQINYTYNPNVETNDNNIYLNNGFINSSNFGNYIPVLRFEDVLIWYDEMDLDDNIYTITDNVLSESKIGFRDNVTDPNVWNYYFVSNRLYNLYNNGVLFKISGDSQYKSYHFHFKIKMKIGFAFIGYMNKFLPIACYKLPSYKKEED